MDVRVFPKSATWLSSFWCLFSITAPDSFNCKKFFQLCGLTKKSAQDVKNVFSIIDNDGDGFVEEKELK